MRTTPCPSAASVSRRMGRLWIETFGIRNRTQGDDMPGTVPEGEASAEYFAINVSTGQGFVSGLQVSRLHRSLTPQVNCGCSDVAAESRFA